MRILVVFILLAFGLVTEGKTQRLNDAKTQSKDSATLRLCDSASYYESQIRKADSLFKNYLPQYNFDEVKAAMEFFDSYQPSAISGQRWRFFDSYQRSAISGRRWRFFGKEADDENRLIAESRQLTAAKAHYYHAVGLTEKDDIVGACEHYLIALEIMEDDDIIKSLRDTKTQRRKVLKKQRNDEKALCDSATLRLCDSDEDYEKIRFVALIYTRLGRLFYDENYCDIAITMYHKALDYVEILENNESIAQISKFIGNSYHLSNIPDSALYYYDLSLKASPNIINKLDIDKCIARIMYDKGEKDSAYFLIENNLNLIENYDARSSYYGILGEMYYEDCIYDSAIIYLKLSMNSSNVNTLLTSSNYLSNIYEILNAKDCKNYYDSISIFYFTQNSNRNVDVSKIYSKYIEEKSRLDSINEEKSHIVNSLIVSFIIILLILMAIYKYRKELLKKKNEIVIKEKAIEDISIVNKNLLARNEELRKMTYNHQKNTKNNIKDYRNCDNCKKILSDVENLKKLNLKINNLKQLSDEELSMLLNDADIYMNNYIQKISNKYPRLKKRRFILYMSFDA